MNYLRITFRYIVPNLLYLDQYVLTCIFHAMNIPAMVHSALRIDCVVIWRNPYQICLPTLRCNVNCSSYKGVSESNSYFRHLNEMFKFPSRRNVVPVSIIRALPLKRNSHCTVFFLLPHVGIPLRSTEQQAVFAVMCDCDEAKCVQCCFKRTGA